VELPTGRHGKHYKFASGNCENEDLYFTNFVSKLWELYALGCDNDNIAFWNELLSSCTWVHDSSAHEQVMSNLVEFKEIS
jgi:hypothetical protein